MGSLKVRADIYEKHQSLFGDKTVNGRRVNVEDLIARLTRDTKQEFRTLLSARHVFQEQVGRRERSYGFLSPETKIVDADGNTATVRDIRQGMLDGFFGRKTPLVWRLNESVPIPPDTMKPGLEGTGPAIDLGMAMGALNTGAASWMWDWEDAGGDYKDQLYQAWENLRDLLAHSWNGKPYVHPTKKDSGKPRQYTIDLPPEKWPTIFHRVPGLHLENRQISLDGEQVPAMIPALVMHAVCNYDTQKKHGSGVYYYVPKVETWQEARLVSQLLKSLEQALGLARGSLKIKMLNERAEYALQQEAIMWVLRENLIGPNVGRWDYLNSREEMFRHDAQMVIPDPNTVTMTEP
jgi:malate synthase